MLIQHRLLSTALLLSLCGTIGFFSAPTPANAAIDNTSAAAQVTEVTDPGELTAQEAFGNDLALLHDVLTPIGNANNGQNYSPETPIKTILDGQDNALVISSPNISTFQDLSNLGTTISTLIIKNQSHLSKTNLEDILKLGTLDRAQNNPLAIGLIDDQLTTADFKNIASYINKNVTLASGTPILTLNVSNNNITDFKSLESIYNYSDPTTNKLAFFMGWHQTSPTPIDAVSVKDGTIDLTPTDFDAYNLDQQNFNEQHIGIALSSAFYYRVYTNNADGTETLLGDTPAKMMLGQTALTPETSVYEDFGLKHLNIDMDNFTVTGGNHYNALDYTDSHFQGIATAADKQELENQIKEQNFTFTSPLSLNTILYNIPVNTPAITLRTMYSQHVMSSVQEHPGFTQDYKFSLNWSGTSPNPSTSTSTTTSTNSSTNTADTVSPKGTVVYATKKIGLYNGTNFTKKGRQHWYRKQPRINRPMFKVTGYANSTAGRPRYLVKDVNHRSKTAGDEGYITTQAAYVAPVYYRKAAKKITIINPNGVNAYRKKSLTGKATHYRQGQTLQVKKLVKHNLTTRYVLTNGRYITANKKLVQNGRVAMPKKLKAKTAINRYRDVNFHHRQKHYRKGSTLTVKGWDFSANGMKRYRVAHGYVTANRHFIKTIH